MAQDDEPGGPGARGGPPYTVYACDEPSGYADNDLDCNDTDGAINPDGLETCDSVDNDCDGEIDGPSSLDATTLYHDDDSDGFGDPDDSLTDCSHPSDYVTDNTDCDDTQDDVNPDATEYCDEEDDDCDGTIDEDDSVDAETWYVDNDSDGFGNASTTMQSCSQPSGYVSDATDCDDTAYSTNPDADEICEDSADNDCDGTLDECAITGDLDASTDAEAILLGGMANDNAGTAVAGVGDLDDDGNDDIAIGAPYYDDGSGNNLGIVYLMYGSVSGTKTLSTDSDARRTGASALARFGGSIAGLGDIDSDGFDDVVVGSPYADDTDTNAGMAYIMSGPITGATSISGETMAGDHSYAYFGFAVAGCDFSQDSVPDAIIGAPGMTNDDDTNPGSVFVYAGPVTSGSDADNAATQLDGRSDEDEAGHAVACVSDNDGDGYPDLVVGAHYFGNDAGTAYVVHGPATGNADLDDFVGLSAVASEDLMGHSVADAGDWDGDGYGDFFVGAPYADGGASEGGETYLLLGPTTSDQSVTTADITIEGANASDFSGWSVASGFDSDDDGNIDVVIGAYGNDDASATAGAAYLFYGPLSSGTWSVGSADATITGSSASGQLGYAVSSAGDTDGDGFDDLLLGARRDSTTDTYAGAVYLFMGDTR